MKQGTQTLILLGGVGVAAYLIMRNQMFTSAAAAAAGSLLNQQSGGSGSGNVSYGSSGNGNYAGVPIISGY